MKHKKIKRENFVFVYVVAGLIILGLAVFFLIFYKTPDSIYVSLENPKQGDTVFIRVKTESNSVSGNFSGEKLVFYRKGNLPEWVAFLGIDADQKSGVYQIFVNTSIEQFVKDVKVVPANFSSASIIKAPDLSQKGYTNEKAVNNIRKNDNPSLNKFLSNFTPAPYFSEPFTYPLSRMENSGFSFGKLIGFGNSALQHLGVDLTAPEKTDIYAVNDGKVVAILDLSNYGKTVIIDHGLDIFSLYLHLEEFKVSEGQMVRRGQSIGLSGDTGYVTAPHLHFSMRVGSSRVDPVAFIDATKKINEKYFLADLAQAVLNIFNLK